MPGLSGSMKCFQFLLRWETEDEEEEGFVVHEYIYQLSKAGKQDYHGIEKTKMGMRMMKRKKEKPAGSGAPPPLLEEKKNIN